MPNSSVVNGFGANTRDVNGQVDVPAGGQVEVPTPSLGFSGFVGRGVLLSVAAGVAHAVGLAVGDDDGGVVQEPVQDADGGGVFGEEPSPLVERPVGGNGQAAAFVGGGDEPEQQLGARVIQRREADLVEDHQIVPEQRVDDLADGVV